LGGVVKTEIYVSEGPSGGNIEYLKYNTLFYKKFGQRTKNTRPFVENIYVSLGKI